MRRSQSDPESDQDFVNGQQILVNDVSNRLKNSSLNLDCGEFQVVTKIMFILYSYIGIRAPSLFFPISYYHNMAKTYKVIPSVVNCPL